jgi:DNA repair photolyase
MEYFRKVSSRKRAVVEIDVGKKLIQPSSWCKKKLADAHLEALKFCEYGCSYCSSDSGMHLKMQKHTINDAVRKATGQAFVPHDAAHISITLRGVVEALESELRSRARRPGKGQTIAYSQLTDGFSPQLVRTGTTRRVLELLLEHTDYRIRVLTKNAIVGKPGWVNFFAEHSDRFTVGLSIGSLSDRLSATIERFTSVPTARLNALHALQDAGVSTYGMLCPVFPDVLDQDHLERLVEAIRPNKCEHVWAETYNDRQNWEYVRQRYARESPMWAWMTSVYEQNERDIWSRYATDLYLRIHRMAVAGGWSDTLRYLLYESDITADDAQSFRGLNGVLLQSKTAKDGRSRHPSFANFPGAC